MVLIAEDDSVLLDFNNCVAINFAADLNNGAIDDRSIIVSLTSDADESEFMICGFFEMLFRLVEGIPFCGDARGFRTEP